MTSNRHALSKDLSLNGREKIDPPTKDAPGMARSSPTMTRSTPTYSLKPLLNATGAIQPDEHPMSSRRPPVWTILAHSRTRPSSRTAAAIGIGYASCRSTFESATCSCLPTLCADFLRRLDPKLLAGELDAR